MNDYIEASLFPTPCTEEATDLLAAFLADAGFESFVPSEDCLKAYIRAEDYSRQAVEEVIESFPMDCRIDLKEELVPGRDWNEEWEKNYFQPILIDDICVIHSTFHKDAPRAKYDIVIDPRMAFGTGHHATTSLMLRYLLEGDIAGKSVIDMGTGTGILAILCSKLGASSVKAIEIDPGACQNALEHLELNQTHGIEVLEGDASRLADCGQADIFMANINRNIILADLPDYAAHLKQGGTMLLSGFYLQDVPMIEARAQGLGLALEQTRCQDEWCALRLIKK